jgi:hypothetical protein
MKQNSTQKPDPTQQAIHISPQALLSSWRMGALRSQIGNYHAANYFSALNYWLGIPAVVFAAVVGTSVFAALGRTVDSTTQILIGMTSVLAAVLAALQTFLGLGDRAAKHRATAAAYGALKRSIDQQLSMQNDEAVDISESTVTAFRKRMDALAKEAPELPEKHWNRAVWKVPEEYEEKI